jgi:altronate hydrolase
MTLAADNSTSRRALGAWNGLLNALMFFFVANIGLLIAAVAVNSFAKRWLGTWLPDGWTASWYTSAWEEFQLPSVLWVTVEVVAAVVSLSILLGVPAAYALARREFPGKRALMLLFLLPLMVPPMTYGIPLATAMYKIGLAGTLPGVVLANLIPMLPFVILVMTPFIEQIDPNLEAAARVCGAGMGRMFLYVLGHVRAHVPRRRSRLADPRRGALLRRFRRRCSCSAVGRRNGHDLYARDAPLAGHRAPVRQPHSARLARQGAPEPAMNDGLPRTLKLHPRDDVVIAKGLLERGTTVDTDVGPVSLAETVAPGHKVAVRARDVNDPVHRYGHIIGLASAPIRPGDHVHLHNLRQPERTEQREVGSDLPYISDARPDETRYFDGYLRGDGRIGTRNYVAILSTVNCSASVSRLVRDRFQDVQRTYPNVDGVIALTHKGGCGHVLGGDDHALLERVLDGYAHHPNIGAFIVIGLGCEVMQAAPMVERHRRSVLSHDPFPVVGVQQEGGVRKAVDAAAAAVSRLLPIANTARRTRRPARDLVLATNCGGSDGHSGITANPALGAAVDLLVGLGGTGVLGETPEIIGAEHLLIRRARSSAVATKLTDRIEWWERYLGAHGVDASNNPSPGNRAGGITTLAEKSLGGVSKGGTTPLVDVVGYAERIKERGFVYMDTPGYDPVSVTGMVAGGANILCFTTGRGSVFGCKPVPSIKLASNSALYQRMEEDMDIDCGVILEGVSTESVGRRILDEVLQVASGKKTKSELAGVGEEEFAPWVRGPVL